MANFPKIITDVIHSRLKSETEYKVTRFHKPSNTEAFYKYLTGGLSQNIDTVYISGGNSRFESQDALGTVYNTTYHVDIFLASNSILGNQLEDVERKTDEMFKEVTGALAEYEFEVMGQKQNFVFTNLTPLFYDNGIDVQQVTVEVQGLVFEAETNADKYEKTLGFVTEFSPITYIVGSGGYRNMAYSPELDMFVGVGLDVSAPIVYSSDGKTWTKGTLNGGFQYFFYAIIWSERLGMFVAGSSVTNYTAVIYTSVDGIEWNPQTNLNAVSDLAEGNGLIVGVNVATKVSVSTDAINWTSATIPNSSQRIAFGGGLFVVVTSLGEIFTSPDGENWSERYNVTGDSIQCATYGNNKWVAMGTYVRGGEQRGLLLTSTDGIIWEKKEILYGRYYRVIWAQDLKAFIAIASSGTHRVVTSLDGINWTSRSTDTYNWRAVAYSTKKGVLSIIGDSPDRLGLISAYDKNGNIY